MKVVKKKREREGKREGKKKEKIFVESDSVKKTKN